jgi:hypothetical protein
MFLNSQFHGASLRSVSLEEHFVEGTLRLRLLYPEGREAAPLIVFSHVL